MAPVGALGRSPTPVCPAVRHRTWVATPQQSPATFSPCSQRPLLESTHPSSQLRLKKQSVPHTHTTQGQLLASRSRSLSLLKARLSHTQPLCGHGPMFGRDQPQAPAYLTRPSCESPGPQPGQTPERVLGKSIVGGFPGEPRCPGLCHLRPGRKKPSDADAQPYPFALSCTSLHGDFRRPQTPG